MVKGLEELNAGIDEFRVKGEIYYKDQGGEVVSSLRAYAMDVPMVYIGPTGSGKTTLVSHLSYLLGTGFGELEEKYSKDLTKRKIPEIGKTALELIKEKTKRFRTDGKGFPLITIQGHEDLDADQLKGRPYVVGDFSFWLNGNAKLATQYGGLLYFDEPGEARPDSLVVIHSLSDHRRELPVEGLGTVIKVDPSFGFFMSFNDKYQEVRKRFKPSTAQRFAYQEIGYPEEGVEIEIVQKITGLEREIIKGLVKIANNTRNLASGTERKVKEGASPREVINAAKLILAGESPPRAAISTLCLPITNDPSVRASIEDVIKGIFKS